MVKAKCLKCEYEWESQSQMIMVSCPSCGNKVRIKDHNPTKTKNGNEKTVGNEKS